MKNKTAQSFKKIFLVGIMPYFWIFAIVFSIYAHTITAELTWIDDQLFLAKQKNFYRDWSNWQELFKTDVFQGQRSTYYRPVLALSFMFDAKFSKIGSILPYHISNIFFHALAASLLFYLLLALKYKKGVSFFAAMMFSAHPVFTQAVAWIPGRNDTLLALFVFSSFIFFLKFLRSKEKNEKIMFLFFHFIFLVFALLTKENAVVLPFLFLFYLIFIERDKLSPRHFAALVFSWFFAGAIFLLALIMAIKTAINQTVGGQKAVGGILLSMFNFKAVVSHIGKIILPFNLSTYPVLPDINIAYGISSVLILFLFIYFTTEKRWSYIFFGALWFLAFLLPSFAVSDPQKQPYFLEHRTYLPSFGIALILLETATNSIFNSIKKINSQSPKIISVIFIAFLSGLTIRNSMYYLDGISYWERAVKTSPHSFEAHKVLGELYTIAKKYDRAEQIYKKAVEMGVDRVYPIHNNLGVVYAQKKMFEEARAEFKKELLLHPDNSDAGYNLGLSEYEQGNLNEAEKWWLEIVNKTPQHANAFNRLALLYYEKKDFEKSAFYAKKIIQKKLNMKPELKNLLQKLNIEN